MSFQVTIPEEKNDLNLGMYLKFSSLDIKEDTSQEFVNRKSLEIFYGVEAKYYDVMKVTDIDLLLNSINKVLDMDDKFQDRFSIDGVEYGFISNLDDITFGELVDIDSNSEVKNWSKLMGILFRPVRQRSGKQYDILGYNPDVRRDMSDMPLGIALGAITFFFDLGQDLMTNILNSLTEEEKAAALRQGSQKNGVGMHQSLAYAMEILRNGMKLQIPVRMSV